jgi:hypothetical protein
MGQLIGTCLNSRQKRNNIWRSWRDRYIAFFACLPTSSIVASSNPCSGGCSNRLFLHRLCPRPPLRSRARPAPPRAFLRKRLQPWSPTRFRKCVISRTLHRKRVLKIFLPTKISQVRIALPPGRPLRYSTAQRALPAAPNQSAWPAAPAHAQVDDIFQLRTKQILHPAVLRLRSRLHLSPKNKIAGFQR